MSPIGCLSGVLAPTRRAAVSFPVGCCSEWQPPKHARLHGPGMRLLMRSCSALHARCSAAPPPAPKARLSARARGPPDRQLCQLGQPGERRRAGQAGAHAGRDRAAVGHHEVRAAVRRHAARAARAAAAAGRAGRHPGRLPGRAGRHRHEPAAGCRRGLGAAAQGAAPASGFQTWPESALCATWRTLCAAACSFYSDPQGSQQRASPRARDVCMDAGPR